MAIIYSYPTKTTPVGADMVLISDTQDSNKTKQASISSIKDTIDVVDAIKTTSTTFIDMTPSAFTTGNVTITAELSATGTPSSSTYLRGDNTWSALSKDNLQEVLNTGNSAYYAPGVPGSVSTIILGDASSGSPVDKITLNGQSGDITIVGVSKLQGDVEIGNVGFVPGNNRLEVGGGITLLGGIGNPNTFTIGAGYDGAGNAPSNFSAGYFQFTTGATASTSLIQQGTGQITIGRASGASNTGRIQIGDNNTQLVKLQSTATGAGSITLQSSVGMTLLNDTSGPISIESQGNIVLDAVSTVQVPSLSNFTSTATFSSVDINGGNIDNTVIGATTASSSKFSYVGSSPAILATGDSDPDPLLAVAALRVLSGPVQFGNTGGTGFGANGEILKSQGSNDHPIWADPADIDVNSSKKVIVNARTITGPIAIGDPLYISGPKIGDRYTVSKAEASDPAKMPVVGLSSQAVATSSGNFTMIVNGDLSIDTATIAGTPALNSIVYAGATGGLTIDRPSASGSDGIQNVGIISSLGASGSIKVSAVGRVNALPNNAADSLWSTDSSFQPVSTTDIFEINPSSAEYILNAQYKYGFKNVAVGLYAGQAVKENGGTSLGNVFLGVEVAGKNNNAPGFGDSSEFNVAIGNQTFAGNNIAAVTDPIRATSTRNVAIGYRALSQPGIPSAPNASSRIGDNNVAIGHESMPNSHNTGTLTEGSNNTFVGSQSGFNAEVAYKNVGIGSNVLNSMTRGYNNVAIGAGVNSTGGSIINTEGNTIIGTSADTTTTTTNFGTAIGGQSAANTRGTALGFNATAQQNCVALGSESNAVGNQSLFNINVAGVVNPAQGGLPSFPDRAAALAAPLQNGDVYVLTPGGPDNPGTSYVLAII